MGKATLGALWAEVAAGKEMEKSVSSGASAGSGNSKNSSDALHKFPAWNSSPSLIFTRDSIFNCVAPLAFKKCIQWTKEKIAFNRSSWPARSNVRQFPSILTFLFLPPRALAWACGLAPSFWSLLQFNVTFPVWSVFLHTGLICLLERAGLFPRYHCSGLCWLWLQCKWR